MLICRMIDSLADSPQARAARREDPPAGSWLHGVRILMRRINISYAQSMPDSSRAVRHAKQLKFRKEVVLPALTKHTTVCRPLPWGWLIEQAGRGFRCGTFRLWWHLRCTSALPPDLCRPTWWCHVCQIPMEWASVRNHLCSGHQLPNADLFAYPETDTVFLDCLNTVSSVLGDVSVSV